MLAPDSLVLDFIFEAGAELQQELLITALGGEDVVASRLPLDPDRQDPRFELELAPSMPFRRRGEQRLMIIDPESAPLRTDPNVDPVARVDLRAEKARLLAVCDALPVRAARLNGLGIWGDAVLVARSARDLRGIALIAWALDPSTDIAGQPRANRLTPAEFEEKLAAYDKRLQELDEKQILSRLGPARLVRHGDYLVIDVLDANGHWDLRDSMALEAALMSIDRFSMIPGAPQGDAAGAPAPEPASPPEPEPEPEPAGPALGISELDGRMLLIFPRERFDLDIAAAMGKRDWEAVVRSSDPIGGRERDELFSGGAEFVAPLEFLSEVFIDGKPLSRPVFEASAENLEDGTRTLPVHCPRFGQVLLLDVPERGRFICSAVARGAEVRGVIRERFGAAG
jgi:hypothetical protein